MSVDDGEFSGSEGLIQPPPHTVEDEPSEQLLLLRRSDEADLAEQIEAMKPSG